MRDKLEALLADGLTTRQIAERLGISRDSVRARCRRAGLTLPATAAAAATRTAVIELTRKGLSAPQIARQLGTTDRNVVRHRTAAGIAGPPPAWWTPEQIKLFEYALTEDGWSYGEVFRTYGAHKATLAQRWPGRGWGRGGGVTYRRLIERLDRVDAEYWANRYARRAVQNRTKAAA